MVRYNQNLKLISAAPFKIEIILLLDSLAEPVSFFFYQGEPQRLASLYDGSSQYDNKEVK